MKCSLQHEAGHLNWVSKVKKTKDILTENGFGIVWHCQGVGYQSWFADGFKDRLLACYKQNRHSKIENSDKYRWFYSFKSCFQAEKYLLVITNKWHRDSLARLRLRIRCCGLRSRTRWFCNEEQARDSTCLSWRWRRWNAFTCCVNCLRRHTTDRQL